jgi:hypothetical protein
MYYCALAAGYQNNQFRSTVIDGQSDVVNAYYKFPVAH